MAPTWLIGFIGFLYLAIAVVFVAWGRSRRRRRDLEAAVPRVCRRRGLLGRRRWTGVPDADRDGEGTLTQRQEDDWYDLVALYPETTATEPARGQRKRGAR